MYNKRFCKEPEKIENYEKAKADNFKGWHLHHKRGVDISKKELIALGQYYNRPADELIFLTSKEHNILHKKGKHFCDEHKQKIGNAHRGKSKSDETKKKMREAAKEKHKGENNGMHGKRHSIESRMKMSDALKGENHPAYGKHWYNNGQINKLCYECPEGFIPGRLN